MSQKPFTIYNASAGSGKTYTLVKEYLKILFKSGFSDEFKRILAITFTNKAVAEMKERIVDTLKTFSEESILTASNDMFNDICNELNIAPENLYQKSKKIRDAIMHNYAAFDISTIDGFMHRIIRTFAHDLKLPLNFEVELDQDVLLNEAVDSLIAKAGTDAMLTRILVDFAIEKADDDKSWDVSLDFNKIAKLLVNENDIAFIDSFKGKTLLDFKTLKITLKGQIEQTESSIIKTAKATLDLIENAGLAFNDFSSGYLPKYFLNLSNKKFDVSFGSKWQENIHSGVLYPKRVTPHIATTIQVMQPQLAVAFTSTKNAVFHLKFLKAFYRNITPLSVLNAINNELESLKTEQNKMLISEFNAIISNEIKNQPTPFIYERIGEKFKYYFIDEFQDTSVLQWQNLSPLLGNSLSTENGSAMLVGDAKQAIYRWRGGKAEQFMGLFNNDNPFHVEKKVKNLPKNFRSFKEIVGFNNAFFKFLSQNVFNNDTYKDLYEKSEQEINKQEAGYVEITFLDINQDDDRDELYCQSILNTIEVCQTNGYALGDICVLVRKKKEGVAIAKFLSEKQIDIVSSETLLLNNSPEVLFLNNMLTLLTQPKNNEIKIEVLNYLTILFNIGNKHPYFTDRLNLTLPKLFKSFEKNNVFINYEILAELSLYDLTETLVRDFNLVKTSNAYIQFYLDMVLEFSHKKGSDISSFLAYFDKKKDSLSIVSPNVMDAVQIMTIHKSKGLEFPVVVFPYADLDIYKEKEPKEWFPVNSDIYNGFSNTLLNFNKDFEYFGEIGQQIYNRHRTEQELDNINLLYVALTRPVEQIHIISKKDISAKGEVNTNTYAGLLISYLQHKNAFTEEQPIYKFGEQRRAEKPKQKPVETVLQSEFISTPKESHNIKIVTKAGLLWNTLQEEAIEKGNLIHDIMAKVITKTDIDLAVNEYIASSTINQEQGNKLKILISKIVNHSELEQFYSPKNTIYTERDIIGKNGKILRPDRLVINNNDVSIIDYKTGAILPKHKQQLWDYQAILETMDFKVKHKILVYVDKTITIVTV
ncbi:MAG: UvrD-helicase domain-containing protein [Aestuariibaculum sp.]